ncbi:hypothetical protein D3C80_1278810 [compost metagenome]
MKYFFVLSMYLLLLSCNDRSAQKMTESDIVKKEVKHFFDYDEIDYYQNFLDKEGVIGIFNNSRRSPEDSFKLMIFMYNVPRSESDTAFISYLDDMGYRMRKLHPNKFPAVDSLLAGMIENQAAAACIRKYRDILIFRKNGAITGTAKFCFECSSNQVHAIGGIHIDGIPDLERLESILEIHRIKKE